MNDALKSSIKAFGTVTLPIAFNVGGTGSSTDLKILNVLLLVPIQSHLMMVIKISQLMLSLKSQPLIQVDICMLPELCQVSIRSQLLWHHNVKMVTHLVQWGSPVVTVTLLLIAQIFILVSQKD